MWMIHNYRIYLFHESLSSLKYTKSKNYKSLLLLVKSFKLTMKSFPLLLVSYIAVVSASCPDGWWKAGEFCYIVSPSSMTWFSAQEEGSKLKILVFTYSVSAVLLGKGWISCRNKESRTRRSFGWISQWRSILLAGPNWPGPRRFELFILV